MSRAYAYSNLGAYATHEDMNFMLKDYVAAAREVARDTGATLVDTFRAFTDRPDGLKLIQDGCHPNAAGQALIAETLTPIVRRAMIGRETNSRQ
jgi:lysophospholipase L1-like esterase